MFVQADKFVQAHGGNRNDISVFGQESNPTTWRLAKTNLAVRGIEGNLGPEWGDSFHADAHPDLRADFVIANPFFNDSKWGGERLRQDPRWKYGVPPPQNANYAWLQHFLHHCAPTGTVGTVLANGSLSSQQNGEGEIRKQYSPDDEAWIYMDDPAIYEEINPGNTLKAVVPFDVAKNAKPDYLLLKAGTWGFSEGVRVKL